MPERFLTALKVYNEVGHVKAVLSEVRRYSPEIVVVDDGSSDGTLQLLERLQGIHLLKHAENRGYGAALRTAFDFAIHGGYDTLVTIDCDGQHEPQRIPEFVAAADAADIVSGSRYLKHFEGDSRPPDDRRRINQQITSEINRCLGLNLSDAFCGFKAYRVPALTKLNLTENGYAMPLELWVQAAHVGLKIIELPVPLIYLDEKRSFGGALDNAATRLEHYRKVIERSLAAVGQRGRLSSKALCGDAAG
jgi:dolichol-phosphate mannosyltransferase